MKRIIKQVCCLVILSLTILTGKANKLRIDSVNSCILRQNQNLIVFGQQIDSAFLIRFQDTVRLKFITLDTTFVK